MTYTVVDYTVGPPDKEFDSEESARAFMRSTPHAMRLWSDHHDAVRLLEEACEGEFRSEVPEHPQAERDWFDRRMEAALERSHK